MCVDPLPRIDDHCRQLAHLSGRLNPTAARLPLNLRTLHTLHTLHKFTASRPALLEPTRDFVPHSAGPWTGRPPAMR
ncbi:hypothetical protein P3102_26855 [Amycolatopsis sp. QT-25]|uniref:hypothetical protein n=1 Tax=Amycolatopsis sp. QT-25 TaxID=3034022 RepID=UPI0023ED6096|nr:hypothetical protein [Amycolatopsis sp. QT-25]WET77677.1 hypothetical protein P3102_26855 [Amycolatopsis sp. QT-25]